MIDITFLHVYIYIYVNTHIPHMLKCALYLLKESGGIFFGGYGIIILGVIFFFAPVGKHREVAIPQPSPTPLYSQTVLCQRYQNTISYFSMNWLVIIFIQLARFVKYLLKLYWKKKKLQVLMQHYIAASCETIKCYSCESHTSDHISHPFNKKDGNMLKCRKW